ncbi:hypothetical protein ILUMI_17430, partial [Ignelater luminosus]
MVCYVVEYTAKKLTYCIIKLLITVYFTAAGVVIVTHIFLMSVKFWSYAFVNKRYRDVYKKKLEKS